MKRLASEGRTVLVSSHILEEVETVADRHLLMVSGKLAASGEFRAIREALDEQPYKVRVVCEEPRTMASALVRLESVESVSLDDDAVLVLSRNVASLQRAVPVTARELGLRLTPGRAARRVAGERLQLRGGGVAWARSSGCLCASSWASGVSPSSCCWRPPPSDSWRPSEPSTPTCRRTTSTNLPWAS